MSKKAIVSVILLLLPLLAAADEVQIDGLWYNIDSNGNTAQVIQYKDNVKYEGDIVIPSTVTYDGVEYSVTSIGSQAFYNCSSLTTINIPEGLTDIGLSAFSGCSSLTTINIPQGVTSIEWGVFQGCSNLTEINIPQGVTSIGYQAFLGCSSLTKINIPQGVTSIGSGAFKGCSSLAEISIPQGVTTIGDETFRDCSILTEINIPQEVTSIGKRAFYGCSSLTEINIPQRLTSIGDHAFYNCSSLTKAEFSSIESLCNINFSDESSNPLYYAHHLFINGEEVTNVIIPSSVTEIGNCTFSGCSSLTTISIPQEVTSIGNYAFSSCANLTTIIIPQSVTSIGNYAFSSCANLTTITIPQSVTNIGYYAFYHCSSLAEISIPQGVNSIQTYTFFGCSGLTEICIPQEVTSIGNGAFSGCSSLTEISIPQGVLSIGNRAFSGCSSLTEINIPQGVTSIREYTFSGCSSLTEINIPQGVTSIGNYAFSDCSSLTEISIPQGVLSIGSWTFYNCSCLTAINFPQGMNSIGNRAFSNCSNLTRITIPQGVSTIGDYAFWECSRLMVIICTSPTPPTYRPSVFSRVPTESCILYVPAESIEAYSTTSPWSSFTHIRALEENGISVEEWAILGTIKDDLVEKGWSKPWDMSVGIYLAESLQGITVANKHVTQLNLSNCQLNGSFPLIVLQLPYLEQLNLSNNQLHGDVCTGIDDANQLVALETLTSINLSHNQLTGNIGAFASHFPQLQSLDASYNSLTEVDPMIPSSVTNLNIGYQSINQTYDFDLTNPSHDYLFQQLPSLLRYDHASQSYKNTVKLLCTTGDVATFNTYNSNGQWGAEVTLDHEQGEWSIPFVSSNYAFQGENGSQLQAMLLDDNRSKTGNTFGLTLHFASGDANFDGDVDVTDLQATILEIMAQHGQTPFNFTAANINNDNDLNVLDVILQVNQLMSISPASMPRANKLKASVANTSASVYVDNGNLIIYSDTPVAAFDIRVSDASLLSLSETLTLAGMTCSVKEGNDGLHLIGYSLTGGLLPTGETCIATLKGTAPTVATAVLADEQARKVATTCNQQPTGITTIGSAQVDIRQDGHQIVLRTDSSGEILFWQLASPDGRVLGKGEADVDNSNTYTIPIDIRHHGLIIFTVRSANKTLINKLINIR